ncbi:hypothetical protein ACFOOK_03240 [Micromonospora krabiensis]|uniref:Uncharacterized protein n=1 Tax=Micromonospora krabiensis TaxID=307121 RepID=A0A1C3MWC7_9ACTN|nr:hypothetical protein [Micromonospora krabiensis]SBV24635.1 hypothetical protein GA0070620_0059 [Micromonospora krabiensis]
MAIDGSGQRRPKTAAAELDAYVREFRAGGYPVPRVVHAACARCGGSEFRVRVDDEAGYADRTCHPCGDRWVMLDGLDVAEDADPGDAACLCGGERFDVAVGFTLCEDGEVRWGSVGLRCTADGVLGVYADWKIDYSPSGHLMARV